MFESYYERFAKWFKLRKELGLVDVQGGLSHPKNRIINLSKFALDNGALSLHFYAFLPALELLASDKQRDYWVRKAHNMEITGAYV
jgi:hypothetical protein